MVKSGAEQIKTPSVGMFFETIEEAQNYYEEYGRQEGFWIQTQTSSKTRRGLNEVTSMQFVCAHEGKYFSTHKKHKDTEETNGTESVAK